MGEGHFRRSRSHAHDSHMLADPENRNTNGSQDAIDCGDNQLSFERFAKYPGEIADVIGNTQIDEANLGILQLPDARHQSRQIENYKKREEDGKEES